MFDRLVTMQHFGLPTRLLDVTSNPLVALFFATMAGQDEHQGRVRLTTVPEERRKYFDSDAVSCVANLANLSNDEKEEIRKNHILSQAKFNSSPAVDRLIQFIRIEKPWFRPEIVISDLFRPYYVVPKMSNRRIIAQHGAFIIYGLDQPEGLALKKNISNENIIIDSNSKESIRKELSGLGIKENVLFPEIEKAARYVAQQYRD